MNATQKEAQEIVHNATAAWRKGEIDIWQWLFVTRLAIKDGYLSAMRGAK